MHLRWKQLNLLEKSSELCGLSNAVNVLNGVEEVVVVVALFVDNVHAVTNSRKI